MLGIWAVDWAVRSAELGCAAARIERCPGGASTRRRTGGTAGMAMQVVEAALRYGYAAVFLGVMIESMGIPFPGETILIMAAAGAARRPSQLNIWGVLVVAILGATLGDNIGYLLGRSQGTRLLDW